MRNRFIAVVAALAVGILAVSASGMRAAVAEDGPFGELIVGGTNATQVYSFMGSLQDRSGNHHCGTTLISATWAVTAGHCAVSGLQQPANPASLQIRFGSVSRTSGGQLVGVSRVVVHPSYLSQGTHDIALLQLSTSVSLAPAPIATTSPAAGSTVRLLGWGQTCPQRGCQSQLPTTLQQLDTQVLQPGCQGGGVNASYELCIQGTTAHTACYGDSGGPALATEGGRFALVGATSRSGGGATCGTGNVIYTNVVAFRSFIQQTTGISVQ